LPKLHFSGPTRFSPVIKKATDIAKSYECTQDKQKYTVLLIITDGRIDDMEETKKAIIKASESPLSILIVGVGNIENFDEMEELDGDGKLLTSGPKIAKRDIVQFVTERVDFAPDAWMSLTERLMAEIPDQLTQYMYHKGIIPNKIL
jgi:hypothetical protein